MSDDLLERLLKAQTPEEETRLILDALPLPLSDAAWAAAIPHWFTPEVLGALLPGRASHAGELYDRLQGLAFVEPYRGRGLSLHDLSRRTILNLWWTTRRDEYRIISDRARIYFAGLNDIVAQVESAYHSLVATGQDHARIASDWSVIAQRLKDTGQFGLAHTLVQNAREHIDADRVSEAIKQLVLGWERNFVVDLERIA
jgi:hypothetical protein